jgi:hypothetical protein
VRHRDKTLPLSNLPGSRIHLRAERSAILYVHCLLTRSVNAGRVRRRGAQRSVASFRISAAPTNVEAGRAKAITMTGAIPHSHGQRQTVAVAICRNAGKGSSVRSSLARRVAQKLTAVAAVVSSESQSRAVITLTVTVTSQVAMATIRRVRAAGATTTPKRNYEMRMCNSESWSSLWRHYTNTSLLLLFMPENEILALIIIRYHSHTPTPLIIYRHCLKT